jgi:REP element-mobilizing transposase RayT
LLYLAGGLARRLHPVACEKLAMILAYHVIFGAYGFWLPNDPRASWSTFVRSFELYRLGPATTVTTRRSLAHEPHDVERRLLGKELLKFPAVQLTGVQARAVAHGFRQASEEGPNVLHACSILPEHVHLVIARHDRTINRIVGHLKARATQQLHDEQLWLDPAHPVWAKGCWKVFLDNPEAMRRAIEYVERNPLKEGKQRQSWRFVVPYQGRRPAEVGTQAAGKPAG